MGSRYSSGRLPWDDGSGDSFEFTSAVEGSIHTVGGVSSVNSSGGVRGRWVAAYSGEWPDGVLGGVVVECGQEGGSIEGMTLTLEWAAGSVGDLVFRSGLFRSGVVVEVRDVENRSDFWYSVGDGVVGDGTYTLRYRALEDAVSGIAGFTHEVCVEVRVGGVVGVGRVRQEVRRSLPMYAFGARHARWERVWADGTREVISWSKDSGYLPLVYREEWVSGGDRRRCHYECILWGFEMDLGGGIYTVEECFSGGLELRDIYGGVFHNAWGPVEGLVGPTGAAFPNWMFDFNPAYCYSDVGVSGDESGYYRVVYGLDTLWGWSSEFFYGWYEKTGVLQCYGLGVTDFGRGLGLENNAALGWGTYWTGTVGGIMPTFSLHTNLSTDYGGGYSLHGYGGSLENGNFDNGYVVLDVDGESGGLACAGVDLELVRHGRRVWSTGAEEVFDGVIDPSKYEVRAGVSDSYEYCVEDVGGWRVSAKGAGCMHEYVGDMVYRDSYGLRVLVGGVEVARLGVLKKGCGFSGLLHVGVSTTSSVYGFVSSMWFRVPGWSLDRAQGSGVRLRVGGRWFPVEGYVSMLDGDSVSGPDVLYRYNLVSLEERLIGLYSGDAGGGCLLSGGYCGGDVVAEGWENPRGFSGGRMDVTYNYEGRGGAVASVSCGGGYLAAGGSDWTVEGVRSACSSWVDVPGAILVAW